MKNKIKIIIIGLTLFISVFLIQKSYALDIDESTYGQFYGIDTAEWNIGAPSSFALSQTFGNNFEGTINKLKISTHVSVNGYSVARHSLCVSAIYNTSTVCSGGTRYDAISSTTISGYLIEYTFPSFTITPDQYLSYTYSFPGSLIAGLNDYFYDGANIERYSEGECTATVGGIHQNCGNLKDIYFAFDTSISREIGITFPTNALITPDFLFWSVGVGDVSTTSYSRSIYLQYSTSSVFSTSTTDIIRISNSNKNFRATLIKTKTLAQATTTRWYARARLYDATTSVALSSTIYFDVYPTSTAAIIPGLEGLEILGTGGRLNTDLGCGIRKGTSTPIWQSFIPDLSPDTLFCYIREAGMKIGAFLFIPDKIFLDGLQSELQSYQNTFPFSLYFNVIGGYQSAINTHNVATTTPIILSIQGLKGENLILMSLNSSTLKTAITVATTTTQFGQNQACNSSCAQNRINNLFLPIKISIWIACGLKIVAMILTA